MNLFSRPLTTARLLRYPFIMDGVSYRLAGLTTAQDLGPSNDHQERIKTKVERPELRVMKSSNVMR